jgi:hypothetical protein
MVDPGSTLISQTSNCFYYVFQGEQMFTPGVANMAQVETGLCGSKKAFAPLTAAASTWLRSKAKAPPVEPAAPCRA